MNKIEPWQFDAYLDGEYDATVAQAVKADPSILEPYKVQHAFEAELSGALHRVTCPEPDDIMNYAWGMLTGTDIALVSSHLVQCEACQAEMSLLMPPAPAPVSTKQKLQDFFKTINSEVQTLIGQLLPTPQLGLAAVRGEADTDQTQIFTIDQPEWDITLNFQASDPLAYQLSGQLLGPEVESLSTLSAALLQHDMIVATSMVNATGVFDFADIPQGAYTLCVYSDTTSICLPEVRIGML